MADGDDWTPADSARDKLDKLDDAQADANSLKKDLDRAKSDAIKLLATTKLPATARSYDSSDSGETIYSKYTHYDYKEMDRGESPTREVEKRYRKMDKVDPKGALYRKLLKTARISRAHVENLPREGKLDKFKMGKLSTRLYEQIDGERTYDKYFHWLPPPAEVDVIAEEVKELLHPDRLKMLSPKEQTLTVLRKTPTKPIDVVLPQKRLEYEKVAPAPPGLAPASSKRFESRGNHKFFNYAGDWKAGKMHGKGTMCYVDGSTHTGRWENNRRNGLGISKYKNGHVYEGNWENDKFHGRGTMTLKSGVKYSGDWVEGKRNGTGVCRYPGGQVYDGGWKNGKKDGWGTFTNSAGFKFVGIFVEGMIEGPGGLYAPDGKHKSKKHWPRSAFSDLIQEIQNEEKNTLLAQQAAFREKYAQVDAENLEAYIQGVRDYNEEVEREKYEMQLAQQRKEREERREKMREAKASAADAMAKAREES